MLVLFAVGAGVALTLGPFILPTAWSGTEKFLHWPMLLVDRPQATWLPLNAGKRLIALFCINVSGWAFSFVVLSIAGRAVMPEGKSVVRD